MEEQTVVTRDAVNLSVRSVQPDDQGLLKDFFGNVSEEDRRFRFLNAGARLGDRQLDPLVSVDHWQTENFLAFDTVNGALVASAEAGSAAAKYLGLLAVVFASVNIFGGFAVTERMLAMYKKKERK